MWNAWGVWKGDVTLKDWTGNAKSVFVCNGASNHTEDERQVVEAYTELAPLLADELFKCLEEIVALVLKVLTKLYKIKNKNVLDIEDLMYQDDGYIARSMFQNEKEKVKVTYPKSQAKDQYEIHYTYRNKTYVRLIQLKDMQPPKLTLKGETNVVLFEHEKYQEDGASAYDKVDKDVSHQIEIKSNVQNKVGTYEVKYFVKDQSGNSVSKIRYVTVVKDPSLKKLYYQHDSYDNTYEEWWFEKSKDHQRNQGARTQDFLQKYQAYYQGKN